MALELSVISKKLPQGITLASLYQINNQSIWFLIWILKKNRFWPVLTRDALEDPFTMEIHYWLSDQIHFLCTLKNNKLHGVQRRWYENGKLAYECYLKDGKEHGIERYWYLNGQLGVEKHWKDDKQDGIQRRWYTNGQLYEKEYWKDGVKNEKIDNKITLSKKN